MTSEDVEFMSALYDDYLFGDNYYNSEKNEKYFWETKNGELIKVDDLEESHIKNIVYLFGKQQLSKAGYNNIVRRFNDILKGDEEDVKRN